MARLISRSKNSYIRSPRRVTLAPMALPSRSLNPRWTSWLGDHGLLARDGGQVGTAPSSRAARDTASPTPMFTTIFSMRGTSMMLALPRLSLSAARISSLY